MSFRPTASLLSKTQSSKTWLARHSDDPYVKQRTSHVYRSRSAFKLLGIDSKNKMLFRHEGVRAVVDLGAAPGGWSQVVAGIMGLGGKKSKAKTEESWGIKSQDGLWSSPPVRPPVPTPPSVNKRTIVALDRLKMDPIAGVHTLQMDFLDPDAEGVIAEVLRRDGIEDGKADVVLSDMAANMTGNRISDTESSLEICNAVMEFCKKHVRSAQDEGHRHGGSLLIKYFQSPELQFFRRQQLEPHFRIVLHVKPDASRSESSEAYWLCKGFGEFREKKSKLSFPTLPVYPTTASSA
ncbi:FtsJ-like methyltransferase-domain-containing protein [Amylostereum chailletii]|nr:FtsJ-like methyltransferase-domain-containing protein [Amylostereum chailletii]